LELAALLDLPAGQSGQTIALLTSKVLFPSAQRVQLAELI